MTRANLQVVDYHSASSTRGDHSAMLEAPLSIVLTQELDGASEALGLPADDILVAALGRAIARTIGEGIVDVHVDAPGPDRAVHPVSLGCVGAERVDATEMLAQVHQAVAAAFVRRIVHGVTNETPEEPASEIRFTYGVDRPARHGHALELHAHRVGDVLALDWWYCTRSFEPYTVQELSEQFPYALIELTSEATTPVLAVELAMAH